MMIIKSRGSNKLIVSKNKSVKLESKWSLRMHYINMRHLTQI